MPPTSHRAKRQYQPSITSFFARPDPSDSSFPPSSDSRIPHITTTPALPSSVQASLLNVGMRVRKSVPEGYKNKQRDLDVTDAYSVKPVQQPAMAAAYSHPRELLPFCGLHKIGGFAEQPLSTPSPSTANDWGWPTHPVNSQPQLHIFTSSTFSTDSTPARQPNANPHKRSFDDTADDVVPFSNNNSLFAPLDDEEPVSPMSSSPPTAYPVSHTAMPQLSSHALRPFAQPRTRGMRRLKDGNAQQVQIQQELVLKPMALSTDMDAENATMDDAEADSGRTSSDFEEADFLRPVWEGVEVEMGGV